MFDKLRRAKSFILKSKHEEENTQQAQLDLSESFHLRRNISIDSEVLARQKRINKLQEQKRLQRRIMSKSHEHLEDQVIEQLRKLNFGDSYTKQDKEFQRRHPAYFSERNFHRRSLNLEEYVDKNKHSYCHRNSGDVVSNFDRNNPAYCSERVQATKSPATSLILGSDGDFLLNRKSVDMSHNFQRRHPAYVSGKTKTGIKSLIDKIVGNRDRGEYSDTSSYSGCSTGSSAASFSYEASKRSDHSNCSTASSSGTFQGSRKMVQAKEEETIFDRNDPSYYSQENYVQTHDNGVSRKRVYNQTKPNVDRSRCLPEDSRNRTKRDGNTNDRR